VVHRPDGLGAFEFAVRASLRAAQLCRGCLPRISGDHTVAVMAQMEIAVGAVGLPDAVATTITDPVLESPLVATEV